MEKRIFQAIQKCNTHITSHLQSDLASGRRSARSPAHKNLLKIMKIDKKVRIKYLISSNLLAPSNLFIMGCAFLNVMKLKNESRSKD